MQHLMVNDTKGILKNYTRHSSKLYIWIDSKTVKSRLIINKNMHNYMNNFQQLIRNGHLLNKIQISSNPSYVTTRIQLPTRHTMHHAQGLTLD